MNEILDFDVIWKFQPIWTCFGNNYKTENQFSSPASLIKVMLLLENELSFATPHKLFAQNVWYFCNMVLIHARAEIEI